MEPTQAIGLKSPYGRNTLRPKTTSSRTRIIKDIITDVIQELEVKRHAKDEPALLLKRVLLKRELGHVKFRYLHKGVLGITVDSSAWVYQLNLQKPELLVKLGNKSKAIKDIRFYIGETQ